MARRYECSAKKKSGVKAQLVYYFCFPDFATKKAGKNDKK